MSLTQILNTNIAVILAFKKFYFENLSQSLVTGFHLRSILNWENTNLVKLNFEHMWSQTVQQNCSLISENVLKYIFIHQFLTYT